MIEVNLRYFDFANFNTFGVRSTGLLVVAVLFEMGKKAASRLLVLVVSMGYGVTRPNLGASTFKVLVLATLYFANGANQGVVTAVSHTSTILVSEYLLLVPVTLLDFIFDLAILKSLNSTIALLKEKVRSF